MDGLLPFGWYYLLKALFMKRRAKMLDLLLVAVKPEYQNKGVNALLFSDLIPVYQKLGFIFAESNPELEMNGKVQAQWEYFETKQHKRRRAFIKEIAYFVGEHDFTGFKASNLTLQTGDFVTVIGGNGCRKINHVEYDCRCLPGR